MPGKQTFAFFDVGLECLGGVVSGYIVHVDEFVVGVLLPLDRVDEAADPVLLDQIPARGHYAQGDLFLE